MSDVLPTPPADIAGKQLTRFNALKHGILSRYTVLPWEDPDEYQALLAALADEHAPHGPTEEHLVEELAGILWRKRRLKRAEAAAYQRGLKAALASHRDTEKAAAAHLDAWDQSESAADAVRTTEADTQAEIADLDEDEAMTRRALNSLGSPRNEAYGTALAALREDTRNWWTETLGDSKNEDEHGARADVERLRRFLESEVLPWFENRRKELAIRPLIREQSLAESLDPDKLERLGRYEVHLDRKLERTLSMLLKLKELRSAPAET